MIKNVIFDVGQVLVAWEPVEAMRALGMDEETVRAVADATVHTSDWDEADRGALSDEELLTGFIRKAPAYEAQIRNFWEHVDRAIYPFPYVGEWMRTLKDKGYRLYILSNYGAWTYAKTKDQSLGFLKDVDGALFSFEVKQIKPEPEIYHSLLERFHRGGVRVPRRQTEQCGRCHRLRHLCHSFYRLRGRQTEIKRIRCRVLEKGTVAISISCFAVISNIIRTRYLKVPDKHAAANSDRKIRHF